MSTNKSHPVPRRNPPPPPSSVEPKMTIQASHASRGGGSGGQLGAFWSTQHAKESRVSEEKSKPIFDEEPSNHHNSLKHDRIRPDNDQLPKNVSTNKVVNTQTHSVKSSVHGKSHKPDTVSSKDFEINLFQDKGHKNERRVSNVENTAAFKDQAFSTFVAEFNTTKLNSGLGNRSEREEALEAELEKLREQLKEANLEKAEITAKYEKLTAICRSQRQELQDLKQALAAKTPSPNREGLRTSAGVASPASAVIAFCNFHIYSFALLIILLQVLFSDTSIYVLHCNCRGRGLVGQFGNFSRTKLNGKLLVQNQSHGKLFLMNPNHKSPFQLTILPNLLGQEMVSRTSRTSSLLH